MSGKMRGVAIAMFLYFSIFVVIHLIHFKFLTVNVVLYAALIDVLVAAILATAFCILLRVFRSFNVMERGMTVCIWLLGGALFALSVPTVIDRSLSIYILEKLDQRGGGIRLKSLEAIFTNEYVREHRLVDVRLTEQLQSGTIELKDGCIILTQKGRFVARLGRYYRQNLLPQQRLLMGEYTDALTDPFRNSQKTVDYQCDR